MKRKADLSFEKSTFKTTDEIKASAEQLKKINPSYDIRSNGNHIWVELDDNHKHFWSPMLRLQLASSGSFTNIKAQVGENPMLWVTFLLVKLSSVGIFILSAVIAWYKQQLGYNFNAQLFVMFGMLSVWFGIFLLSESYKRRGKGQIEELCHFVDAIAA